MKQNGDRAVADAIVDTVQATMAAILPEQNLSAPQTRQWLRTVTERRLAAREDGSLRVTSGTGIGVATGARYWSLWAAPFVGNQRQRHGDGIDALEQR